MNIKHFVFCTAFENKTNAETERYLNKYCKTLKSLNKMIKVGINGFDVSDVSCFPRCNEEKRYSNRRYQWPCPKDYLLTCWSMTQCTVNWRYYRSMLKTANWSLTVKLIRITAERNPADLKWNEVEAEYVVNLQVCSWAKTKLPGSYRGWCKICCTSAPSKDDTDVRLRCKRKNIR